MSSPKEESAEDRGPNAKRNERLLWYRIVALAAGTVVALLTISLYSLGPTFFGDSGFVFSAIVFPGVIGSMAVAGNAHAFSLWIAAGINFILYILVVWLISIILRRIFWVSK
jgi:hypothetical protein